MEPQSVNDDNVTENDPGSDSAAAEILRESEERIERASSSAAPADAADERRTSAETVEG